MLEVTGHEEDKIRSKCSTFLTSEIKALDASTEIEMRSTSTPVPYDVHFCFPVRELENECVKLTPFIPSQHVDLFFQGAAPHPELFQHMPLGPFTSPTDMTQRFIDSRIQPNPGNLLFAIIDKTRVNPSSETVHPDAWLPTPANFAGTIGYLNASPTNASIEIGFVIIFPPFQRTHVTTHAVGLLLRYALDLPRELGLGLRRVQWQTNALNGVSMRVAERVGMKYEAQLRWDRVFEGGQGKVGNGEPTREGDPRPGTLGRHTAMLAMCWDDWENGGRDRLAQVMDKYSPGPMSLETTQTNDRETEREHNARQ